MADRRFWAAAGLLVLLAASPALAAELGDLGRMPVEEWRGDRLSREDWGLFASRGRLAVTAAEIEMHGRLARFFDPAERKGWIARFQHVAYADAGTRYRVLEDAVATDLATLPPTFAAVCAVLEIDGQRQAAAAQFASGDPTLSRAVARRVAENAGYAGAFATVLGSRYDSYSETLNRLLVETPDRLASGVDDRLWELAGWVEAARRGDFCAIPAALPLVLGNGQALPSRVPGRQQPAFRK